MKSSTGSSSGNFGLLLLRLFFGVNLFVRYGLAKITHFSGMQSHFPDPIHIGSHWSFVYAFLSDAICALLVVLGLGTRIAALIITVNLAVAFCLVHRYPFATGHGELLLLYIGGFLAITLMGAGAYSLDGRFWGRG